MDDSSIGFESSKNSFIPDKDMVRMLRGVFSALFLLPGNNFRKMLFSLFLLILG